MSGDIWDIWGCLVMSGVAGMSEDTWACLEMPGVVCGCLRMPRDASECLGTPGMSGDVWNAWGCLRCLKMPGDAWGCLGRLWSLGILLCGEMSGNV